VQNWQKNFFMADKFLQNLNPNIEFRNSKQYRMTKTQISKREKFKLLTIESQCHFRGVDVLNI